MQPESKSPAMQGTSNYQFRPGILASDARHHPGPGGLIDNVHHEISAGIPESLFDIQPVTGSQERMKKIKVVDLFAGPGGLGEGFARFSQAGGERPFQVVFSAEKDHAAVRTLRLRTFYRLCEERGRVPDSYYNYLRDSRCTPYDQSTKKLWEEAGRETQPLELGTSAGNRRLNEALRQHIDAANEDWVLIGGPPCQAYSLVGRSRNKGIDGYKPEKDKRHFLYREYLKVLSRHQPAAFVMENVKGILTSRVGNRRIFPQILKDLSAPGNGKKGSVRYRIHSLVTGEVFIPGDDPEDLDPRNFIVRSEDYGIPQARHRVILVGIRDDGPSTPKIDKLCPSPDPKMPMRWAIQYLPPLRSGLSRGDLGPDHWKKEIQRAMKEALHRGLDRATARRIREGLDALSEGEFPNDRGGRFVPIPNTPTGRAQREKEFLAQMQCPHLNGVPNHHARGHMPMDLVRYLFATTHSSNGSSPKANEFPESLAPAHKNWNSGHFTDRFRVQVWDRPSTTITSHISKDGHYFIHPNPAQCRSLTVREAARLQTFPDDYFFEGSRTEQYIQVGNAVPPMIAKRIAKIIAKAIG